MSHLRPDETRYPPGPPLRPYPRMDDRNGRKSMYDDDHSPPRSRSPGGPSRTPPRGPAGDRRRDYAQDRADSRPRYRSREDDFRGRSSRSPPRRPRHGYRDRDREDYRSRSRSYSLSRSRSPRRGRPHYGQESREVMLDGLPVDMVEEDISNELKELYHIEGLEEVRVIRDRQTKMSRQLGFLRFRGLNFSRSFVEQNFPTISLCGPDAQDDRGTKVRIAYSREKEDRAKARAEGDWNCPMCSINNYSTRNKCFRCQAPRPDSGPSGPPGIPTPRVKNNGDNDAAPENQPSQFLLFRQLEISVTEELLAKGVAKLYRPNSEGTSGSQKKGKVASTTGDSNLGARDGSIRRILLVRDRRSNESWRYGFAEFATIQDAQAAVQRLHSFDKFTISSRPVMVTYIHAGVFVPVMNPSASTERFTFSPLNNPALKLMYWDEDAYVTELTVSTDPEPQQAPKTEKPASQSEIKGKEAEKAKKRKADAASSASGTKKMAMPSHLQFWSNRHAELHGIKKKEATDEKPFGDKDSSESLAPLPQQSYADSSRNCCYLCMREFKTMAEVNRHERLSKLHRGNLQDDEAVAKATNKLIKHGIIPQPPEYRDRARERRKAFGRGKNTGTKPAPAPEREPSPPAETTSKGASLLSKMGWSAGTGLGAQGTGMTAPIATEVYAQGVGLGAQGGKLGEASEEAARNTRNNYGEFVEQAKQKARDRYDQMGK